MPIHLTISSDSSQTDKKPLVSVIIPCYKQAQYLAAAIESVLKQTYTNFEIIVVDDGSPDDTAAVVSKYPAVKYIRQTNCGSASARNTGWKACVGTYVLFLDADDLLLKDALSIGVNSLNKHEDAALTFGRCHFIFADTELGHIQNEQPTKDFYSAMLKGCLVWHPAAMMCRRSIFESGIAFDESLVIGSDYDFYLTVTRQFPIHCHNQVTSQYVQHGANKSYNLTGTVQSTLAVLSKQKPYLTEKPEYEAAYKAGIDNAYNLIAYRLLDELSVRKNSKLERERILGAAKAILIDPRALPRVVSVFQQAHIEGRIVCDSKLALRILSSVFGKARSPISPERQEKKTALSTTEVEI